MTDTTNNALASLATILNDGAPATFTPADTVARLSAMEGAATDMGKAIGVAESAIGESAKAWGCNFLNLVKRHGIDGDTLAERCRTALGWADLRGDAGSKVKTRFNTWRSNIGKVSGAFDTLDVAVRDELLGGTRSFITVYKSIIDDEKRAKREADAAKAAAEKALADAAAAEAAMPEQSGEPVTDEMDFFQMVARLRLMIDPATLTSAHVEAVNALVADMNTAAEMIEADAEPESAAA